MSEKRFSTDEIVATVMKWRGWDMDAVDEPAYKEIIARLHAADVLCEAAKKLTSIVSVHTNTRCAFSSLPITEEYKTIRKAIAGYEGKEE